MKFKFVIILLACFAMSVVACKKQNAIQDKNLYNKCKLVEMYDVYGSGGSQGWHTVSGGSLQQIEFTANGQYKKTYSSGATFQKCFGTYRILTQNKVEIYSNCDPAFEKATISELANAGLILDYQGTEGLIRYKYKANK